MINEQELRAGLFTGFVTVASLRNDPSCLPLGAGVYAVVYSDSVEPQFRERGTGGRHKDRDPNVSLGALRERWNSGPTVVYFGKASADSNGRGLQKRLSEFLAFGSGKPVGHWGGRHTWQLPNAEDLLVCWKETPESDPRQAEKALISDFATRVGKRPFANING